MTTPHPKWLLDQSEKLSDEITAALEEGNPAILGSLQKRARVVQEQISKEVQRIQEVLAPFGKEGADVLDLFTSLMQENELADVGYKLLFNEEAMMHSIINIDNRIMSFRLAMGEEIEGWPGHKALGEALEAVRDKAKLSQEKVGQRIGLSRAMIGHIEAHRDNRTATLEQMFSWVDLCGRRIRWQWFKPNEEPSSTRASALVKRLRQMNDSELDAVEALLDGLEMRRSRALAPQSPDSRVS